MGIWVASTSLLPQTECDPNECMLCDPYQAENFAEVFTQELGIADRAYANFMKYCASISCFLELLDRL